MSGHVDTERILDAFLAPEHDQLADRVLEASFADIARTPQRRALRVPWRFPNVMNMSSTARNVLVAALILGALGGGTYLVAGRGPTPTPTPASTPAPTPGGPGITSFTSYTSAVYGITFGYPDGWRLHSAATRRPQAGDGFAGPYGDIFANPEERDGDAIVFSVWRQPAGSGDDITSRQGLAVWLQANEWCDSQSVGCETVPDVAVPMCAGIATCGPAILAPLPEGILAAIADVETRTVTVVALGRHDDFSATARYGGGVQLLKSILTTLDVWTPAPGQIPAGS